MYYPKALVVTDLYTNGAVYVDLQGKPYVGYYWQSYNGTAFTGKNPEDPMGGALLVKKTSNETTSGDTPQTTALQTQYSAAAVEYDDIAQLVSLSKVYIPYSLIKPPTTDDYSVGQFTRYFCKRTNAEMYMEIDNQQFTKLSNRSEDILWQLYTPFSMFWKLTGDREQVYTINRNLTQQVINEKKFYRFADFLKNQYLLYYKG